jgi:hypothetical protein
VREGKERGRRAAALLLGRVGGAGPRRERGRARKGRREHGPWLMAARAGREEGRGKRSEFGLTLVHAWRGKRGCASWARKRGREWAATWAKGGREGK